ncbi:MAG: LytTR family DNA-binding domain-containing protein [Ignavibacteriaceae bacterium]|nr:LytTR family DNA-binding domain-containing protein [Ignavibacteriaceae bacterium]
MKEKPVSILIVEDDTNLRENISEYLSLKGYNVFTSSEIKSSIKILNENDIDLILCDINLGQESGYDLSRYVSVSRVRNQPGFVFISAMADRNSVRKGMDIGADDYLTKPFSMEELINLVNGQLIKRSRRMQPAENGTAPPDSEKQFASGDIIFIESAKKAKFQKIEDILLIKSSRDYSIIRTCDGDVMSLRKSLSSWENELPEDTFIRINRSLIVNIKQIISIEKGSSYTYVVKMRNYDETLSISQRFSKRLREMYRNLLR